MSNANVIDFKSRAKVQPSETTLKQNKLKSTGAAKENGDLLDMVERRQAILQDERRQTTRTILSEFVGAFAVIPGRGLMKVALYDISTDGLAFDTDITDGHFNLGEDVAMRVYLNQKSYFPFVIKLQNLREVPEEGVYRQGAHFVKGTINDEALHHFVRFIETVSATLEGDHGDLKVSIS
jgi:hypothetical protein